MMATLRQKYLTKHAFSFFKSVLPPMSQTEKEAIEAGSVWWDGELFAGSPQWSTLLTYPKPSLTQEEQAFIDFLIGKHAEEVYGHSKSSFSWLLNASKNSNNYYDIT